LVLDTRELGRRPGSMRRVSTTVPAPDGLGAGVLGVPAGTTVALELRLESVMDGVLVSGTARTQVTGECVRCLDPLEREVEAPFQELYAYPGDKGSGRAEPARDDDDDLLELDGVLLDLEPVLRDAIVLALPFRPLCDEDCPGLCVECGARLADDPEHHHEVVDARWAALQAVATADPQTLDPQTLDQPTADAPPVNGAGAATRTVSGSSTTGSVDEAETRLPETRPQSSDPDKQES
jgi:uncharacterized protein